LPAIAPSTPQPRSLLRGMLRWKQTIAKEQSITSIGLGSDSNYAQATLRWQTVTAEWASLAKWHIKKHFPGRRPST